MNLSEDFQSHLPKINEVLPKQIHLFSAKRTTKYFDSKNFCDARTYSYMFPSFTLANKDEQISDSFQLSQETLSEFNEILKLYIGTHNFHNFTAQKKPTDASANRYIISFECSEPFTLEHEDRKMQFLVARIKGQSFMLHQIRKMIGLAISIVRGHTTREVIDRAFGQERIDVPIAPGLGLLLEQVHYDRYNQKYGGDGIHEAITWDHVNPDIEDFKHKFIYPHIVKTEIEEKSMSSWLDTLPLHTFGVRTNHINERPPKALDNKNVPQESNPGVVDQENDQPDKEQVNNKRSSPEKSEENDEQEKDTTEQSNKIARLS